LCERLWCYDRPLDALELDLLFIYGLRIGSISGHCFDLLNGLRGTNFLVHNLWLALNDLGNLLRLRYWLLAW
jgi:membrane-associated PAP2 superfamily phosphatase